MKIRDISNSVKKLLGLDAYTNMMSHLYGGTTTRAAKDSVMGYYEGKINQSATNDVQGLIQQNSSRTRKSRISYPESWKKREILQLNTMLR